MKKIEDNEGNIITINDSGVCRLKLSREKGRIRNIGIIKDNIYYKFDTEKNIFRKLNAWSIPQVIYDLVDVVVIKTTNKNYTYIKKNIKNPILHFKSSGIERKVYIPLKYFVYVK